MPSVASIATREWMKFEFSSTALPFLPAAKPAGQWMTIGLLSNMSKKVLESFRSQGSLVTWVIEVTEFNSEVVCDLRGHYNTTSK